jgi:hypothetical protein
MFGELAIKAYGIRAAAKARAILLRTLLVVPPADISWSHQITSSRTPWRIFVALVAAGVLYRVSNIAMSHRAGSPIQSNYNSTHTLD